MEELVPLAEEHLPLVLSWRNNPEVRKHMYTQHEITSAEHKAWFDRVRSDPSSRYFVFHEQGVPAGVVGFTRIDPQHKRASWAFYSGALDRPGIGSRMELAAINYAFGTLGLDKLWCEVLSSNPRVITFHRKFGFQIEGRFRNEYLFNGVPADVVRLALFRDSWQRHLAKRMEDMVARRPSKDKLVAGVSHEERIVLTREMIAQFAELSGDWNPIHRDADAARKAGFASPIAHGMLLGAMISGVFGTRFPGEGTIYMKQSIAFLEPAAEGETLLFRFDILSRIGRLAIIGVTISRESGQPVIATGEAELLLPKESASPPNG